LLVAFAATTGSALANPLPHQLLERSPDIGAYSLAANAGGDRVVAVPNQYARRLDIFTATPGGPFGAATRLTEPGEPIFDVAAAVAPDATTVVLGEPQTRGGTVAGEVVAVERPPGGQFGAPQTLTRAGADEPAVAFDRAGNAIAVWIRSGRRGYTDFVEQSTRPAGGDWSAPAVISREPRGADSAQVAFDAAGDATAVWGRERSPVDAQPARRRRKTFNAEIVAATRPAGGSFGPAQVVSDPRFDTEEAVLSVNAAGGAAIVWSLNTKGDAHFRVGCAFRDPGQQFGPPRFFTPSRADASAASVFLDDAGRSLFTWRLPFDRPDPELSAFWIAAAAMPPSGSLAPARRLSGTRADFSQLAMTPAGAGVVSWVYNGSYGDLVQARRATSEGKFGPLLQISPRGTVDLLSTTIDSSGAVTFVWIRGSGVKLRLETATLPARRTGAAPPG